MRFYIIRKITGEIRSYPDPQQTSDYFWNGGKPILYRDKRAVKAALCKMLTNRCRPITRADLEVRSIKIPNWADWPEVEID